MSVEVRAQKRASIPYLIYADDIVIFHAHKDINHSSNLLNYSLGILDAELNSQHFSVAPQKCKVIFFVLFCLCFVLLPPPPFILMAFFYSSILKSLI